jgi:hypothetical protein
MSTTTIEVLDYLQSRLEQRGLIPAAPAPARVTKSAPLTRKAFAARVEAELSRRGYGTGGVAEWVEAHPEAVEVHRAADAYLADGSFHVGMMLKWHDGDGRVRKVVRPSGLVAK